MNKKLTLAHLLPPYFDGKSRGSRTHTADNTGAWYVPSLLGYTGISVISWL